MTIIIETERLILRFLTENDLDNLEQLNAEPDVRAFFPDGIQNREQTKKRMLELINNHKEHNLPGFIISEKESNAFLGRCGFSLLEDNQVEVGYLLHKNYWNKGYATEALNALLDWAKKNIKRQYIIAFSPTRHIASQRVMQKCGMTLYKTDIAHGVECKFYKINNTPIKARISHVALLITDLKKAKHFYGNILGLSELKRPPFFIKGLWYDLGDLELHLMLYEQAEQPQVHPLNETVQAHFALSMPEFQLNVILEKLKTAGIKLIVEPSRSPAGVLQVFFYDFDKNMIELNNEE
jgi:RimJ/RimL family protein N-acetyltransferase/catechol 2,3-dioxygenase-like lactoylglutathione lyase family enzyme